MAYVYEDPLADPGESLAPEVLEESRLLPEQVKTDYDADDLLQDTINRVNRKAVKVRGKIVRAAAPHQWPFSDELLAAAYPSYTASQIAAERELQTENALEITKLYALSSLFGSAGQLDSVYWERASELREQADEDMASLLESVAYVVSRQPAQNSLTTFSHAPHRVDSYSKSGTEYSRGDSCSR